MPAKAGVLLQPVARRDVPGAMPEQAAEVADFLPERRRRRIGIVFGLEQQWMPALRADVFMAAVPVGEFLVGVFAEEARQRMPHARHREVFTQVIRAAPAAPMAGAVLLEDVVVDVMSPHRARDFPQ